MGDRALFAYLSVATMQFKRGRRGAARVELATGAIGRSAQRDGLSVRPAVVGQGEEGGFLGRQLEEAAALPREKDD